MSNMSSDDESSSVSVPSESDVSNEDEQRSNITFSEFQGINNAYFSQSNEEMGLYFTKILNNLSPEKKKQIKTRFMHDLLLKTLHKEDIISNLPQNRIVKWNYPPIVNHKYHLLNTPKGKK